MIEASVVHGDCLEFLRGLPENSAQTCVTSPPYYGLRDYGIGGQIGLEDSPEQFIERLVTVFREVRKVLVDDGTLWLNIGDSYSTKTFGHIKSKDLIGIPWMLAFALRADGWYLRQDIIWHKPNPMPESVKDRCTKAHEYVFLLSKSPKYFYDSEAIKEPAALDENGKNRAAGNKTHKYVDAYQQEEGEQHRTKAGLLKLAGRVWKTRNKRSVWTIRPQPFKEAHFATMPLELARLCVQAGSRPGDTVLDPFMGAYTTAYAALELNRNAIGAELNADYIQIGEERIRRLAERQGLFGGIYD